MTTTVPGIKAQHAVISDDCRLNRGNRGAVDEAIARVRVEYESLLEHWPIGKEAKFHLVLTVDYPRGNLAEKEDC